LVKIYQCSVFIEEFQILWIGLRVLQVAVAIMCGMRAASGNHISIFSGPGAAGGQADGVVILDVERLTSSTLGDTSLQREVIGMFRSQVEDVVGQTTTGVNAEEWRFLAHTLRGTAAAVGAMEIAVLGETWERQGAPPHTSVSGELKAAWQRFESALAGRGCV
jgi:HPt (histidine-containing phosphotransfer) domain-containing protein